VEEDGLWSMLSMAAKIKGLSATKVDRLSPLSGISDKAGF
jgi:hypothetical protein